MCALVLRSPTHESRCVPAGEHERGAHDARSMPMLPPPHRLRACLEYIPIGPRSHPQATLLGDLSSSSRGDAKPNFKIVGRVHAVDTQRVQYYNACSS